MTPTIFREYDIRGVAGEEFDASFAWALGRAFGSRVRRLHPEREVLVAVGRDCRLTSDEYANALIRGLVECGVQVLDIGQCPTPLLYFSLFHYSVDGGVEVTASHNAADYNGFKMCLGRDSMHGEAITSLRGEIEARNFVDGEGCVETAEILEPYLDYCKKQFGTLPRRLKVVADAGNGVGGPVGPRVLENLGCEVIALHCEPDGRFPNHHPDPTVEENLEDLIRTVAAEGADLGVAFDGDADRLGVVAPGGKILWGDELLVIFAREILARRPGSVVISEVKCSRRLFDEVTRLGGRPIMWKAGHSLIKAKMKETDAVVGAEMSGHLFFGDRFFGYDDAVYAAARLIEILASTDGKLVDLLAGLPEAHATPELRVDCSDTTKFAVAARVTELLRADWPVNDIDGVRADFGDGWGLVRASNTQPALVLRFEAGSEARRDELRALVEAVVAKARAEIEGGSPEIP
ncbi:MAG: phosphomannomutase/phosphoglucomutase [Candidatus Binatia bacterium]|nr:phosphomannomutase/phosphoglucomutase [Candidatus Binatia bacterium]